MQSSLATCHYSGCCEAAEIREWCKPHYGKLYREGNLPKKRVIVEDVDLENKMATCVKHGRVRLRVRTRKSGAVYYACRVCERGSYVETKEVVAARNKRWAEANPDKVREKVLRNGKKKYGWENDLTLDRYDALLSAQGGVCAICSNPPSRGRSLAVDHCHSTGKIRGLLCADCNLTLGRFKDDAGRFEAAAKYLRKV